MGNNLVRYKAEVDFDGRELTRSYLDKHDLIAMLEVLIFLFCFSFFLIVAATSNGIIDSLCRK